MMWKLRGSGESSNALPYCWIYSSIRFIGMHLEHSSTITLLAFMMDTASSLRRANPTKQAVRQGYFWRLHYWDRTPGVSCWPKFD